MTSSLRFDQAPFSHPNGLIWEPLEPQHARQENAGLDQPIMLEADSIAETNSGLVKIDSRVTGEHPLQVTPRRGKIALNILDGANDAFANQLIA